MAFSNIVLMLTALKFIQTNGDAIDSPFYAKKFVKNGLSTKGVKDAKDLQPGIYEIEVSGIIENYSKWKLDSEGCHAEYGWISTQLISVFGGQNEGFASHKVGGTTSGSMVHCSLVADDDVLVQFTYVSPYNFDLSYNWMSIAICEKYQVDCRGLDANAMHYNTYPFLKRRSFYDITTPIMHCYDNMCLIASMESSHQPTISIKLYPKSPYNLSRRVLKKAEKNNLSHDDYKKFMADLLREYGSA